MPNIISLILLVISYLFAAASIVALIDCARRPAAAFPAINRVNKVLWIVLLAVAPVVLVWWGAMSLLGIGGIVAICVYFADVRPRIKELTGT